MNNGKICVSVCGDSADATNAQILDAGELADVIEIRFDCLTPNEIKPLAEKLGSVDRPLVITFRPREQGGRRELTLAERLKFWEFIIWQLNGVDFTADHEFDLDLPLDLDDDRAIISIHDVEGSYDDLVTTFEALSGMTGKTIKIAIMAHRATDAIDLWRLRDRAAGSRLIAVAMGEAGKWTRILGLAHGAPMTYASLSSNRPIAPGQISASDLRNVFRVTELDEKTDVYGVLADDTSYSLSPYMHNRAFRKARLNSVFVPLQIDDVAIFLRRMVRVTSREVDLNFRGFSVTNPHKQSVLDHLDEIDETAREIGAVNTVKIEGDRLIGFNTDAHGFIEPLRGSLIDINGARVAVVGTGGAARACVYALRREGAEVTVLARDVSKAAEFDVAVEPIDPQSFASFDLLVNATPLGTRGELEGQTIATASELRGVKVVYDLVYNPSQTRLLVEAAAAGARTLGGIDMLVAQGARQFEIWTGLEPPVGEMRSAIEERLNHG